MSMGNFDLSIYMVKVLRWIYSASPSGNDKVVDELPKVIKSRYEQLGAIKFMRPHKCSRDQSLTDLGLLASSANFDQGTIGVASHAIGAVLNECDYIAYKLNPGDPRLYFDWKWVKWKLELIMKYGGAPYQNIIRGVLELGYREALNPDDLWRHRAHPLFKKKLVRKPAKLFTLPGCGE